MAHSTAKRPKQKAGFPLFKHATGRWCKKVRGKFCYFGKIADDPDGQQALALWLEQRDELLAGRTPAPRGEWLTLHQLSNRFLEAKERLVDSGELSTSTWQDYHDSCRRMMGFFGKTKPVEHLTPEDFAEFRADMAKGWGAKTLANEIVRCRVLFKFAYDQALIDRPIRYGQGFKKPAAKVLRKETATNGIKMFEAAELRDILDAARQPLRAFVLLACNGGLGNTDVSDLPLATLLQAIETDWLDYARIKTGITRRIPLWRETTEACREALTMRPVGADPQHKWRAFLTQRGQPWVTSTDSVSREFLKLLKRPRCGRCGKIQEKQQQANKRRWDWPKQCTACRWKPADGTKWPTLYRRGVSFYTCRRVFQTVASNQSRDEVATSAIMGHVDGSMASVYRQRVDDDRLQAVVQHVHGWLWPAAGKAVQDG